MAAGRPPFRIIFRPRALREIDEAWERWKQHPDANLTLFGEAIAEAVRQLREFPASAPHAEEDPSLHKMTLTEIECLMFYRVRPRLGRVEVVRFRHGRRKPLRKP